MGCLRERNLVCHHGSEVLVKCPEGQAPATMEINAKCARTPAAKRWIARTKPPVILYT